MKEVRAEDLVSAVAILDRPRAMTRKEKLIHWAGLVRKAPADMRIFHRLEYWREPELTAISYYVGTDSAFGLALADPAFNAMGLKGEQHPAGEALGEVGNVRQVMDFFDITQAQLHEFSCDCGGSISRDEMANRIERLAG